MIKVILFNLNYQTSVVITTIMWRLDTNALMLIVSQVNMPTIDVTSDN